MKTFSLIGLLNISILSFGQSATFVVAVSGEDRIALAKTNIHLTEWHEKSFWSQYDNYLNKSQELSQLMYSAIAGMAIIDKSTGDQEAFDNGRKMIDQRYAQLALWQKYYAEIGVAHNGVIALQFIQTEVLLDLLQSSRTYEQAPLEKFHFYVNDSSMSSSTEKNKTLSVALSLSKTERDPFFKVYSRYEHECDDLLGNDYGLIGTYAVVPTDFTPGQAKLLGYNLLEVMRREIKLKEKYFTEMNTAVGSSLAARFLAWEDYYSLVSKMDAWAHAR